jgi:thioredoxin 1
MAPGVARGRQHHRRFLVALQGTRKPSAEHSGKSLLGQAAADSAIMRPMDSKPLPATLAAPAVGGDVLVACLCADWCGSCRDYRGRFEEVQARFPEARFLWVDIEDQAALVDPVEVENFPSIMVLINGETRFFGTVLPHLETLDRLIRAQLDASAAAAPQNPEVAALAQRLLAA